MQPIFALLSFLALSAQASVAETIIGFDGKEHQYKTHRDGLHDKALYKHAHIHDHHSARMPHMLNRNPIIVSSQNLHITKNGLRVKQHQFGTGKSDEAGTAAIAKHENSLSKKSSNVHNPKQGVRFHGGYKEDYKKAADAKGAPSPVAVAAPAPMPMSAPAPSPFNPWIMDEDMGAPEQGFAGEIVEHDNMKTMTRDWHGEYGPKAKGLQSYHEICALYPENRWCRLRGYHVSTPSPKSATVGVCSTSIIAALFVLLCSLF